MLCFPGPAVQIQYTTELQSHKADRRKFMYCVNIILYELQNLIILLFSAVTCVSLRFPFDVMLKC
jgi:hypothetical protein